MRQYLKQLGILVLVLQFVGYSLPANCLAMVVRDVSNVLPSSFSEERSSEMVDHSCCQGNTAVPVESSTDTPGEWEACECSSEIFNQVELPTVSTPQIAVSQFIKDPYLSQILRLQVQNLKLALLNPWSSRDYSSAPDNFRVYRETAPRVSLQTFLI